MDAGGKSVIFYAFIAIRTTIKAFTQLYCRSIQTSELKNSETKP